ncbi:hypothetical protein [Pseudonocardia abyssalis]|uniref:Oxidoreductase molybdopterin-binding domain-containing protein n=1 Tax=Pseudonocardia abyssalis TaxID=2792008 RepID=A0ABS6UYB3_9PSEU|nr:hypothetical protein [Pseudonocardia abyssalis]MBW0114833.1 hypothetical protein [Pseudonocardia abyssalis]MBW0137236.1 hypothetical protein [Pseudonocardia abyssalis]
MTRLLITGVALAAGLLVGCGAPAATTAPAAAGPVGTAAPASVEVPPAGTVRLSGDLVTPTDLTIDDLAALPQQTAEVTFGSSQGQQTHSETGPALADVLPVDALAVSADRRNNLLSFAVLAIGADGYSAAVAYGDVSADFGDRGLLLSLVEDGQALERPRLIVPGDVRGGRYVSDVVELRVVRLR